MESAVDRFGEVGILVNNAGAAQIARTWEMSEEEWQRTLDVCLTGPFLCTKTILDHMLDRDVNGGIVNISSRVASVSIPASIGLARTFMIEGCLGRDMSVVGVRE